MLVTSLILVLVTGLLGIAGQHRRNVQYQKQQVQAYYIAEAGIERVMAQIREDPSWLDRWKAGVEEEVSAVEGPYAGGQISKVTLHKTTKDLGWEIEIVSQGKFMGAQKTLKAKLQYTGPQGIAGGLSLLPDAQGVLDIKGNFSLNSPGSARARLLFNGDLVLSGSTDIKADIYASGNVSTQGSATKIEGQVHSRVSDLPRFPDLDLSYYRAEAERQGRYYTGNREWEGKSLASGTYYVTGDLTLSGSYSGQITLVAEGEVEIQANSSYQGVTLISLGDVRLKGNGSLKGVIISRGSFAPGGSAEVEGAVVAKGLDLGGSGGSGGGSGHSGGGQGETGGGGGKVTLKYNPQFVPGDALAGVLPQLRVLRWSENFPVF